MWLELLQALGLVDLVHCCYTLCLASLGTSPFEDRCPGVLSSARLGTFVTGPLVGRTVNSRSPLLSHCQTDAPNRRSQMTVCIGNTLLSFDCEIGQTLIVFVVDLIQRQERVETLRNLG